MTDVTRERVWRKLQALPDQQLYQVLDFIEFLESKYAPGRAAPPDAIQRFAERLEDGLRMRSVAPRVISGTVGIFGAARKVVQGVSEAGREILAEVSAPLPQSPPPTAPPSGRQLPPGNPDGASD
jgi:hypothetical protein